MKTLNEHFQSIRDYPELMNNEEINELLELGTPLAGRSDRNYLMIKVAATLVIISSIALAVMFSLREETKGTRLEESGIVNATETQWSNNFVSVVQNLKGNHNNSNIKLLQNPVMGVPEEFTSYLMPNENALQELGITVHDDYIKYEGNVDFAGYLSFKIGERQSVQVSDNKRSNITEYDFYPMFISDIDGYQGVKFMFQNEDTDKLESDYFDRTMNNLVPIIVEVPRRSRTSVFWFSPSPALFKILDDNIGSRPVSKEMKEDEVKEKLMTGKFEPFIIYPNPASNEAGIEAKFKDETVSIDLVDMKGSFVSKILPTSRKNGVERIQFDVSNIRPGIYLVVVNTDKRGKSIQRIIISR